MGTTTCHQFGAASPWRAPERGATSGLPSPPVLLDRVHGHYDDNECHREGAAQGGGHPACGVPPHAQAERHREPGEVGHGPDAGGTPTALGAHVVILTG